jgi:hypothetical protein
MPRLRQPAPTSAVDRAVFGGGQFSRYELHRVLPAGIIIAYALKSLGILVQTSCRSIFQKMVGFLVLEEITALAGFVHDRQSAADYEYNHDKNN